MQRAAIRGFSLEEVGPDTTQHKRKQGVSGRGFLEEVRWASQVSVHTLLKGQPWALPT